MESWIVSKWRSEMRKVLFLTVVLMLVAVVCSCADVHILLLDWVE